ncbi:MAG: hypothetical protein OIF51_17340 [Cellvibrionaceae bacterium]|nr:hypothetical protein [Cellvibrionaceae bacterium]
MSIIIESNLDEVINYLTSSIQTEYPEFKKGDVESAFAWSQVGLSTGELKDALPFMLSTDEHSIGMFCDRLLQSGILSLNHNPLYDLGEKVLKFPVIAGHGYTVEIRIDWDDENISLPYLVHDSNRGSTWLEHYGHASTYQLPYRVTEEEYARLVSTLKPLAGVVSDGYSSNGEEQKANFTDDAEISRTWIRDMIETFEFECQELEPASVWDVYGENFPTLMSVENMGLTEIVDENGVFISHTSTSDELRQLVGAEMERLDYPCNPVDMYKTFVELRDELAENAKFSLKAAN